MTSVEETVPGVLFRQASRLGEREYLHHFRDGEWRTVTWSQMAELVTRAAAGLVEAGVEAGQTVVVIAQNRLEWLVADWAIQTAGAVTVPIYPSSTQRVVEYICRDASAVLAIAGDEALAAKAAGAVGRFVLMDTEFQEWLARDLAEEQRVAVDRRYRALRPADINTIIYTSGTTGDPKGVELTHSNFVSMAAPSCASIPITEQDVEVSWMPLSHVYERVSGAFCVLYGGSTVWLSRGREHMLEDIALAQPTIVLGVPRVWELFYDRLTDLVRHGSSVQRVLFDWGVDVGRRWVAGRRGPLLKMQHGLAERLVYRKVRRRMTGGRLRCFVSGGAPLNEKVEEFYWAIGIQMLQGYGATETTSGCANNTPAAHRYRTVGRALPGTELKVAEDGEILVRGPGVMRRYHNLPEKTAETITADGWLKTGDLGFIDGDGYVTITDRKKDLIKTSGGKYVAPLPIEAQLENDRYIKSAVVVGDQRPYCVALLVPDWQALAADAGFPGDPEVLRQEPALQAFFEPRVNAVNRGLASFETVKYFALLPRDFDEAHDELTPSSKIKRKVITEHFRRDIERLYEMGARRS